MSLTSAPDFFFIATRALLDLTGKRTREVCHPLTNLLFRNPEMISRRPFRLLCCFLRFHTVSDKVSTRPSRRPFSSRAVRALSCLHHVFTAMKQKLRRKLKQFTKHTDKIDTFSVYDCTTALSPSILFYIEISTSQGRTHRVIKGQWPILDVLAFSSIFFNKLICVIKVQ